MVTLPQVDQSEGALLAQMLSGHRTFLESIYSVMRFLEAEVTKRDWDLIKNGGYAVTRNGSGSGLASFAGANWVLSHVGLAFVRPGLAKSVLGVTNTHINSRDGLELLVFQVRWLEKSPEQPVVWCARLRVQPEGTKDPRKWEEYQSAVLGKIEPETKVAGTGSGRGRIKEGKAVIAGASISYQGNYLEVPVVGLLNESDVLSKLVEPGLRELFEPV